jgi:hypothetical protein
VAIRQITFLSGSRLKNLAHHYPRQSGTTSAFIFHETLIIFNPSGRTMVLGLTQTLTEMSIRNISLGVKAAGSKGWQPYHLHVPIFLKSGSLNFLEPSGPEWDCFTFTSSFTFFTFYISTPNSRIPISTCSFHRKLCVFGKDRDCNTEWNIYTSHRRLLPPTLAFIHVCQHLWPLCNEMLVAEQ